MRATMYGWPKSPTWPNALRDTNLLFDNLVRELGMSRGGPRYILGDFNMTLTHLEVGRCSNMLVGKMLKIWLMNGGVKNIA